MRISLLLSVIVLSLLEFTYAGSNSFYVGNGQIYDNTSQVFFAKGLNVDGSPDDADQILKNFPGMNFVRFASSEMQPPSYFQNFINTMSSHGVVVEIEYHPWPLINATVTDTEANWYASLAQAYMNNAYVWFGTMNEPQGGDITGEHVNVYNAIRNTGSDTIILMEAGVGAGNPGMTGPAVLDKSKYTNMYNVAWDLHFYGWASGFSTDQSKVNSVLLGCVGCGTGIQSAQEITCVTGKIPVLNAEFGPSTDGQNFDANQDQVIYAVTQWAPQNGFTSGFSGWWWCPNIYNPGPDDLQDSNGQLTDWGWKLANAIKNA